MISDRDKGLNAVNVKEIMPNIEHVYCCKHIERNLKSKFKGFSSSVSNQFWKSARSTCQNEFDKAMQVFAVLDNDAYTYITELELSQWTSLFCPLPRHGCYTSNASESLNSVFKEARYKNILDLLRDILNWCRNKFIERANVSLELLNTQKFASIIRQRLDAEILEARKHIVHPITPKPCHQFEVESPIGSLRRVDISPAVFSCPECPNLVTHGSLCRHLLAVFFSSKKGLHS